MRGVKTRNKLNTDEQFQNRIDMKIKNMVMRHQNLQHVEKIQKMSIESFRI